MNAVVRGPGSGPEPRQAATVILSRVAAGGAEREFLLLRRHRQSAFMGGAFVFPGGKLAAADVVFAQALLERAPAPAFVARLEPTPGGAIERAQALALGIAGARELFEEANILLVRAQPGQSLPDATVRDSLREKVQRDEGAFARLLEEHGWQLDVEALGYWDHWITPSAEPRRFDTRFFVASLPEGQEAAVDAHEATECRWMTPASALEAHAAGEIFLPPPTLCTLLEIRELARDGRYGVEAQHREVAAIMPKVADVEGEPGILLPWDPLYAETAGEGLDDVARAHRALRRRVSRVVLSGGRWQAQWRGGRSS